jgi:hypothetical protein
MMDGGVSRDLHINGVEWMCCETVDGVRWYVFSTF